MQTKRNQNRVNTQTNKESFTKGVVSTVKSFSLKNWFKTQVESFHELINKLKNLRKANVDLGIAHFNEGRTKDAIFRFKIVNRFFPDVKIANYYLGRSYIENWDFTKAKTYLEKYLESGDLEMRDKAKYCYDLALERYDNVSKIPTSIVRRIFNNIAEKYDAIYLWQGCPQEMLLTQIRKFREQGYVLSPKDILDVGCGNGSFSYELKCDSPNASICGIDISNKLAGKANQLKLKDQTKVMSEVLLVDLESEELLKELSNKKFDIIVFSLVFDYISDIQNTLESYAKLLNKGGLLGFTFQTNSKKSIHTLFDREYEEFYHSEGNVASITSGLGLIELASDDATYLGDKIGKVKLYTNNAIQKKASKEVPNEQEINES